MLRYLGTLPKSLAELQAALGTVAYLLRPCCRPRPACSSAQPCRPSWRGCCDGCPGALKTLWMTRDQLRFTGCAYRGLRGLRGTRLQPPLSFTRPALAAVAARLLACPPLHPSLGPQQAHAERPLHPSLGPLQAALEGRPLRVRLLLRPGSSHTPDERDAHGRTAMHWVSGCSFAPSSDSGFALCTRWLLRGGQLLALTPTHCTNPA